MDLFILHLIKSLQSIDGRRGTATPLLDKLRICEIPQERKFKHENTIYTKILFKYKIMRIRAKISFIAFQKRMTILELFVSTI